MAVILGCLVFAKRFDELGGYNAGNKTVLVALTAPIMRTATGLHGDMGAGRQMSQVSRKSLAFEFMLLQNTACFIDFAHGKRVFGQIDTDECRIHDETSSWLLAGYPAWLYEAGISRGSLFLLNQVQMQPGLSMAEFMQRYGTAAQCEQVLAASRWSRGFRCPACHCSLYTMFERGGRSVWQCRRCHHQITITAGTIFDSSKLPLTTWFLAMHLLTQAKNNVSMLELRRQLGVSWHTAWRVKHKPMQVMAERESHRQLSGRVEIDDAYLGGEHPGTPGRGSPNKIPFVMAVSTVDGGKPHQVVLRCLPFKSDAMRDWANSALSADTQGVSDGLPAFQILHEEVASHLTIVTGSGRASAEHPEFRWENIMLGNLKTAISGTYHAFKFAKYAPRYLAEFQYRFNRRYDLRAILPRLLRAAATTRPWPEHQLTRAELCA